MNYTYVETDDHLADICEGLLCESVIGVDLEADSMYSFKDKICLIQVASKEDAFVIDPFSVKNMQPFLTVLDSKEVCKIFHGSDFDVRSLDRDYGVQIQNLFDTEIASRFLGINERGLGALVKKYFDVQLDKKFQKEDWSRRPLRQEMIEYSVNDVLYLIDLYDLIGKKLENCNRLAWAQEEFEIQAGIRYENNHSLPLFRRFKGAGKMDNRTLAVLENLLLVRLDIAEKKDRPLFKVISNAALLAMATKKPGSVETITENRMLSPKQARMYGGRCVEAVRGAMALAHKDLPSYPKYRRPRPDKAIIERVGQLKTMREKLSSQMGMEPGFLLNNALIGAIAQERPGSRDALLHIEGIRKWQVEAIGNDVMTHLGYCRG